MRAKSHDNTNKEETKEKDGIKEKEGTKEREECGNEVWSEECGTLHHTGYVRASLVEPQKVIPATAGHVALNTQLVECQEAIFEPCRSNSHARIFCPGIQWQVETNLYILSSTLMWRMKG